MPKPHTRAKISNISSRCQRICLEQELSQVWLYIFQCRHTCIKSSFCCPSRDTGQRSSGSSVATCDHMRDHFIVILTCPGKKTAIPLLQKDQCSGLTLTMNMTISMTKTENLTLKMTKRPVLVVQQAPQDGRRTRIQRPLYPTTSVSGSERCFCNF